jgi:predicted HicB family RNase H-like nuclease
MMKQNADKRKLRNARYHEASKQQYYMLPLRLPHEQAQALKLAAQDSGLSINSYLNFYLMPVAQVIHAHNQQLANDSLTKGKSLATIVHQALMHYFTQPNHAGTCHAEFDALFGVDEKDSVS